MNAAHSRLVVAIPGGDNSLYTRLILEELDELPVSVHVVLPDKPAETFTESRHLSIERVEELSADTYAFGNIGAPMASGSWSSKGMLILPADATLIRQTALGLTGSLITRTADVMLKEREELVIIPFEERWDGEMITNMVTITEAGGTILPPFPSFYTGIDRIEPMVRRTARRALMQFDGLGEIEEWAGIDR